MTNPEQLSGITAESANCEATLQQCANCDPVLGDSVHREFTFEVQFVATLECLNIEPQARAASLQLFREIAVSWCTRRVMYGAGFTSVLTGTGFPVELSFSLSEDQAPRFRFTVDFGTPGPTPEEGASHIHRVLQSSPRRFLGRDVPDPVSKALASLRSCFYRDNAEWFPTGLGAEVGSGGLNALKYYFNPGELTESTAPYKALMTLITGREGNEIAKGTFKLEPREVLESAFGLGVDVSRDSFEPKVYSRFWKTSGKDIGELISKVFCFRGAGMSNSDFVTSRDGHVDVCSRYSTDFGRFHVSNFYFLTRDFFNDDLDVLRWARVTMGHYQHNLSALDSLEARVGSEPRSDRRLFTFVGVGMRGINIYFLPLIHRHREWDTRPNT